VDLSTAVADSETEQSARRWLARLVILASERFTPAGGGLLCKLSTMKMNTGEKIKLTITLNEYDAQLLEKALQTVYSPTFRQAYGVTSRNRNWVILWAIRSVSAAIIRAGKMSAPLAVELRSESEEESRTRMACEIPDQTTAEGGFGFQNYRWN